MKVKDLKKFLSKFNDNCDIFLTQYVIDDEKKECIEVKYGDILLAGNGKKENENDSDELVCMRSDILAIVPQIQYGVAFQKIQNEKYEIKSAEAKMDTPEQANVESKAEEPKGE